MCVTLPINDNLILVPFKTRTAIAQGETTIGYFSLLDIYPELFHINKD